MASHRLIQHIGKRYGLAASEAVYDRLNEYYFVEGHSLNDRPRLANVVATLLSDILSEDDDHPSEEYILEFLNGDEGRQEIMNALNILDQIGVHGIPKFIVEGYTMIDGAAGAETFVRVFRDIEQRGEIRRGPVFGEILGVSDDIVNRGSHFLEEEVA